MAVTGITISQNNKVGAVDLLAAHSPLVFLASVFYSGLTAPDLIYINIYDISNNLLGTYKALFNKDITAGERQFKFIADSILRGLMDDYEDFQQGTSSLDFVTNITKYFKIKFYDVPTNENDFCEIFACHGTRQYGQTEAMQEVYNNVTENVYVIKNKPVYGYVYNENVANVLTFNLT